MISQSVSASIALKNPGKGIFWKEWAVLTIAGMLATFAVLPAQWPMILQTARETHQNLLQVLGLQLVSAPFQAGIIVGFGLWLAQRAGLGAPILKAWLQGVQVRARLKSILLPSVLAGVIGALVIAAANQWLFLPLMPGFSSPISQVRDWQGILASFYGGIGEELVTRLFALSLFAWVFGRFSHTAEKYPSSMALWAAIVLSAVIFSLGHLPATALAAKITPLIILRSMVLNGGLGMLYGYYYWKHGLESAMLAHFSSDIVLHFLIPLLFLH